MREKLTKPNQTKPNQTYEPHQEGQSQAEHTLPANGEMIEETPTTVSLQKFSCRALGKAIKSWWKERHWKPGDPFYTVGPIDPGDPVANVYPESARKFLRRHEMTCREYDITTS